MISLFRSCFLLFPFLTLSPLVFGATINFSTAPGASVGAGQVNASATFTTSAGFLTVTLRDLLPNPGSVGQLVSDVDFTLSSHLSGPIILSSSAQQITINGDRTTTLGPTTSTGWGFGTNGIGFTVCVVCPNGYTLSTAPTVTPSQTIIGPGPYIGGNGSIAGNPPHNPFLNQTAVFVLANSGITGSTAVSNVVFSFGTAAGADVHGVVDDGGNNTAEAVPEPSTANMLLIGGAGVLVWFIKNKK